MLKYTHSLTNLKEFYPDKVKHGKTTYLDEAMSTRIKLAYQNSGRHDLINVEQVQNINTDLEMEMMAKKVMDWQKSKINMLLSKQAKLQKDNQEKTKTLGLLMKSDKLFTTTQVGQEIGLSAKRLNEILKEQGYIYFQSGVWIGTKKIKDKGYLTSKETLDINGKSYYHTYWTPKGRLWILEMFKGEY